MGFKNHRSGKVVSQLAGIIKTLPVDESMHLTLPSFQKKITCHRSISCFSFKSQRSLCNIQCLLLGYRDIRIHYIVVKIYMYYFINVNVISYVGFKACFCLTTWECVSAFLCMLKSTHIYKCTVRYVRKKCLCSTNLSEVGNKVSMINQ